ncbi:transporter substrate-binding domain-containing protein [Streptococcus parauberis]|uniref:Transporter substrate-binding domain-containing protein n=1 Tax=Streptococcus parauberis TaxID=1348 RepID=A0AAE4HW64_9STRE|nr:transporter substrate-binding domain-containing protein [Streptococcus parauberis]MDT2730976.1 transporter substrate-binding domain-containing protein [Streptococcus parauberis]PIO78760.1 Glutamine-binding periplasmic protein precursor [Streptococcus parauberis]
MNKKQILTSVVATMALLSLSACGNSSKESIQDQIKKDGKLVVALSPDYAPFEFKTLQNGKDTIVGSDVQLAQAIADELGVKLEISPMSFDNVLSSVQTGKADMAISGISYTEERAKVYDFSKPYYSTENAILIKASNKNQLQNLDSLANKKVAVQKGTIEEGLSKEQLKSSHIVSLTAMSEAVNELKSGQVDAVDLEGPVAEGYLAQNPELAIADYKLKTSEGDAKAVAMPKGSKELKATTNKVITKLKAKDDYKKFIKEAAKLTGKAVD